MVFFPQTWIELWEYSESDSEVNFYGEASESYYIVGEYFVDFQNLSPKDNPQDYGKLLEDTFKIYLESDTPITDTMVIRKKNDPTITYKIKGSPQHYNTLIPHIKVIVQRTRKPVKLI